MKIRTLTVSDKEQVGDLYRKLYPTNKFYDLTNGEFWATNLLLGMEVDGKIVGFIQGIRFNPSGRIECYINDLIIDEKYRGKGYGSGLVKAAEIEFKKMGGSYIFVFTDFEKEEENPVKFYEKNGYQVIHSLVLVKNIEGDAEKISA